MLRQLRKLYGCLTPVRNECRERAYLSNKLYTPEGYFYYLYFMPVGRNFEEGRSHMMVDLRHQHAGRMLAFTSLKNEVGEGFFSIREIPPAIEKALLREKQNLEAAVALGVQVPTRQV
jgi:hypothetical protein